MKHIRGDNHVQKVHVLGSVLYIVILSVSASKDTVCVDVENCIFIHLNCLVLKQSLHFLLPVGL